MGRYTVSLSLSIGGKYRKSRSVRGVEKLEGRRIRANGLWICGLWWSGKLLFEREVDLRNCGDRGEGVRVTVPGNVLGDDYIQSKGQQSTKRAGILILPKPPERCMRRCSNEKKNIRSSSVIDNKSRNLL